MHLAQEAGRRRTPGLGEEIRRHQGREVPQSLPPVADLRANPQELLPEESPAFESSGFRMALRRRSWRQRARPNHRKVLARSGARWKERRKARGMPEARREPVDRRKAADSADPRSLPGSHLEEIRPGEMRQAHHRREERRREPAGRRKRAGRPEAGHRRVGRLEAGRRQGVAEIPACPRRAFLHPPSCPSTSKAQKGQGARQVPAKTVGGAPRLGAASAGRPGVPARPAGAVWAADSSASCP
jgi:hypothetical protein